MKVLLIDDDPDKRDRIAALVREVTGMGTVIDPAESLRSGLRKLLSPDKFDLVLLDMSMPSFDIGSHEPEGGSPESFAGRDLLEQMRLRGISTPTVVVTQYRMFDRGSVTLENLDAEFSAKFSEFYRGAVYYNSATEGWRKQLTTYLLRALEP
ncbi:MAG: hypothetical protein ABI640_20635 [Gammaproteobacteria bacterium]